MNDNHLQQLLRRVETSVRWVYPGETFAIYRGQNITIHLEKLGVPQLAKYLIWIPPESFDAFEYLGEGGFAKVYKGTIRIFIGLPAHTFAMKEVKGAELALNVLMFSPINGVVNIQGLTQHPQTGVYLMIMDYADGGSLDNQQSPLTYDWKTVARLAHRLALCIDDIHSKGFMHNDIHPGNVVFFDNIPKLADIGQSTLVEAMHTSHGVYGRLDYLPPEVFPPGTSSDRTPASDIYCFATVLWQMVTGIPPKGNADAAIRNNPDGLREELIPGAPEWFNELLRDCWNPIPEKRPSISEVKRRLALQLSILQSTILLLSPLQSFRVSFPVSVPSPFSAPFHVSFPVSFSAVLPRVPFPRAFLPSALLNPNFTKMSIKHRFTPDTLWFIANRQANSGQETASSSIDNLATYTSSIRSRYHSSNELRRVTEIEL